jgi:ribonuclease HI
MMLNTEDFSLCPPAMTEWLGKWKRNGWTTSQSEPVKNKEDMVRLDNACQKIDVKWVSVPHKESPHNLPFGSLSKYCQCPTHILALTCQKLSLLQL